MAWAARLMQAATWIQQAMSRQLACSQVQPSACSVGAYQGEGSFPQLPLRAGSIRPWGGVCRKLLPPALPEHDGRAGFPGLHAQGVKVQVIRKLQGTD